MEFEDWLKEATKDYSRKGETLEQAAARRAIANTPLKVSDAEYAAATGVGREIISTTPTVTYTAAPAPASTVDPLTDGYPAEAATGVVAPVPAKGKVKGKNKPQVATSMTPEEAASIQLQNPRGSAIPAAAINSLNMPDETFAAKELANMQALSGMNAVVNARYAPAPVPVAPIVGSPIAGLPKAAPRIVLQNTPDAYSQAIREAGPTGMIRGLTGTDYKTQLAETLRRAQTVRQPYNFTY